MDILSIYPEIIDEYTVYLSSCLNGVVHCMHCKIFAGNNFYLKRTSEEILNPIFANIYLLTFRQIKSNFFTKLNTIKDQGYYLKNKDGGQEMKNLERFNEDIV